jgi:nucleotide-binding universal stress UspA family protein/nitrite reductase/ring-hydroxylating ferredoxin subunit
MGGSRRLRLGTVAERIAGAAPCDVLIVHTKGRGSGEPTQPYARVLIATDGSPTATEAARRGFEIANAQGADVVLVHVGDPLLGAIALERTMNGRPGDAPASTMTREGDAAEEIVRAAEESGAGLVVVGNRGIAGLKGRLLGSVPGAVAHASPVDVLIVRTEGRAAADLSPGTAGVVDLEGQRAAVYVDDSGLRHAVSARCQHLGCTVGWNAADRTWDCPCHGSRYTFEGKVIRGPATKDLPVISTLEAT